MATHTLPPDEELVLVTYLRTKLTGTKWEGSLVSNRLTTRTDGTEQPPKQAFAVIARSDGGPSMGPPTYLRRFGIRIFGPDGDDNGDRTGELARHVESLLHMSPEGTREIAACLSTNGPYRVPQTVSRPEAYITCELVLVGTPIT